MNKQKRPTPETDGQLAAITHEPRDVAVRRLGAAMRGMERRLAAATEMLKDADAAKALAMGLIRDLREHRLFRTCSTCNGDGSFLSDGTTTLRYACQSCRGSGVVRLADSP